MYLSFWARVDKRVLSKLREGAAIKRNNRVKFFMGLCLRT